MRGRGKIATFLFGNEKDIQVLLLNLICSVSCISSIIFAPIFSSKFGLLHACFTLATGILYGFLFILSRYRKEYSKAHLIFLINAIPSYIIHTLLMGGLTNTALFWFPVLSIYLMVITQPSKHLNLSITLFSSFVALCVYTFQMGLPVDWQLTLTVCATSLILTLITHMVIKNKEDQETLLKEQHKQVLKNEERLMEAQFLANIGDWKLDVINNERYWSETLYDIYEVTPPISEEKFNQAISSEVREEIETLQNELIAGKSRAQLRYAIKTPSGTKYVLTHFTVQKNRAGQVIAIKGTTQNITHLMLKEAELNRISELLKRANNVSNIGHWTARRGQFPSLSEEIYNILEVPRDQQLTLKEIKDFIIPEDRESVEKDLEAKNDIIEFRIETALHKTIKHLRLILDDPMFIQGKFEKQTGVVQDITEYKEVELRKKEKELVSEKLKFKNNFMANMSHEIRTPLNGVIGMLDVFDTENLKDAQREQLRVIRTSSGNLMQILNDIMQISKLEAGNDTIIKTQFDLVLILQRLKMLYNPMASQNNNRVFIEVCPEFPMLYTDKIKVEQIISNLLSNALKFTHNGIVSIRATIKESTDEQFLIKIEVKDSGIGISSKDQEILFEKFTQVDSSFSRNNDGAGLGLAICRELLHLLGGEISLESQENKGSNFMITIPSSKTQDNSLPAEAETINNEQEKDWKGNKEVLLVEDKATNRLIAKMMLTKLGFNVTEAINGIDALEKYNSGKFGLILMDIQMPLMNGLEAVKKLRDDFNTLPPIVAVTANAMEGDESKYLQDGFDYYIPKPLTISVLTNTLNSINDYAA